MKRKMASKEKIPNYSKTNGGNGSYTVSEAMEKRVNRGKKKTKSYSTGVAPSVARYLKA